MTPVGDDVPALDTRTSTGPIARIGFVDEVLDRLTARQVHHQCDSFASGQLDLARDLLAAIDSPCSENNRVTC